MRNLVLLFSLLLINYKVSANSPDSVRRGYSDSVKFVLENIKTVMDSRKIEFCIPTSIAESLIYFSFDYKKEFSPAFEELQGKMVQYSINGNKKILKKYLYMSEFVDGYFAEDYFVALEKIATSKQANFCKVLATCEKQRVVRLSEARSKYCN
jgi:hypothetical protein